MDPWESAPAVAAIIAAHSPADVAPASCPVPSSRLPALLSGAVQFEDLESVIAEVRRLHKVDDLVVTPHKSKYEARIIMTDILTLLKPLLRDSSFSAEELQWLTEQIGRLEYLNGVNHIEAEETSAGEKMLSKAMLKFKDNVLMYPFDVMDGYNHLGIVWSNRTQHASSRAYLQRSQRAFLQCKKLRAKLVEQLTEEERTELARRDKVEQEREAVTEEDAAAAAAAPAAAAESKQEEKSESKENGAAASASSPASAVSGDVTAASAAAAADDALMQFSLPASTPGYQLLSPSFWQSLEVTHTLTLFFLAQVFGHLKQRDLAALYCHLCLNRQLSQRADFQRREWVTNAIGLSFYYSGRRMLRQAHHCLLAAQHFVKESDLPKVKNTPTADTSKDQQLGADLCRAWGAFYLKWLQRSRDAFIEQEATDAKAVEEQDRKAAQDIAAAAAAAAGTKGSSAPASDAAASASTSASTAAASSSPAAAASSSEDPPSDPASSLLSLPPGELAELKRLQRLDRTRERHFEDRAEEEADEDEDDLFGQLKGQKIDRTLKPGESIPESKPVPADRSLPNVLDSDEAEAMREELRKEELAPSASSSSATSAPGVPTVPTLLIEFKSLHLPASPLCVYARSFPAARLLFQHAQAWFQRAALFYILDGYVSDHIPLIQDQSLAYKCLAAFETDLQRQCIMHKRRIDLLSPIYSQLSVASFQEFYQQITDELASTTSEMLDLKLLLMQIRSRVLGPKFTVKQREAAQTKANELALKAVQYYTLWLASWSKDGKEVATLDPYYHRWYLMAKFKIARCYSKIYHTDGVVLNEFTKRAWQAYQGVVTLAKAWNAEACIAEELALCKEMCALLPKKMDRVVAKGGFTA